MPLVWESPKTIEGGLTQALANFVYNKSGLSYAERSIKLPTQELKEEDIDEALGAWWSWVKEKWEDFKRRNKERELRKKGPHPVWMPALTLFGDNAIKETQKRLDDPDYQEKIDSAIKDLENLIGFKAYAYQKRELYEIEEGKEHLI